MNTTKELTTGRISSIQKNAFFIRTDGEEYKAKLKGGYGKKKTAEWPIVGDYVEYDRNPQGDSVIRSVLPRKSVMKRPDQSGHAIGFVKNMQEQYIAANFDYVFIAMSLNGNYNFNRAARYVSLTLETDAVPVVVLTKADLTEDAESFLNEIRTLSDRVKVHAVSAKTGDGMEQLKEYFAPGKTVLLVGSSGVGKSTLVNAVIGREVMKTSAIREEDAKGRHTTTYRQLIELENGVTLIDTPGMREIGVMDAENGIEDTFADVEALALQCKFRDCTHGNEPGCAIRRALETGELDSKRYELWQSLSLENAGNAALSRTKSQLKKKQIAIAKRRMNIK